MPEPDPKPRNKHSTLDRSIVVYLEDPLQKSVATLNLWVFLDRVLLHS